MEYAPHRAVLGDEPEWHADAHEFGTLAHLARVLADRLWFGQCPFCERRTPWPWYGAHCGDYACFRAYYALSECPTLRGHLVRVAALIRASDRRMGIGQRRPA